ncbi:hypothetical protein A4H02_03610 [Fervidobacterium thailandense]|uniref:Uncharacterized protein n=1 Tax=Fervidobacterium thailandense TaxID=1008305 RepID=A0A1E3G4R4_9BACT|nr:hypothetical protein A4H02_03610 [Fervidobacterium thailandense]
MKEQITNVAAERTVKTTAAAIAMAKMQKIKVHLVMDLTRSLLSWGFLFLRNVRFSILQPS